MKGNKLLVLLIILIILTPFIHAKECPDVLRPRLNLSEKEELFEDTGYSRTLSDQKLAYLNYFEVNSSLENFNLNKENNKIEFTPSTDDLGIHELLFLAVDSLNCYISKLVTFRIYDRPRITPVKPDAKFISMFEGQGMLFAIDVEDKDNDIKNYDWYLNDVKQEGDIKDKYPFTSGYNSTGTYELKVIVNDSKGLSDTYSWIITLKDKNRDPYLYSEIPDLAVEKTSRTEANMGSLTDYFGDADNDTLHYVVNATDIDGNAIDVSSYVNEQKELVLNNSNGFNGVIIIEIYAKDLFGGMTKSNKFKAYIIDRQELFGYSEKTTHICGDKICGGEETCNNCYEDCGPCLEGEARCENAWKCDEWTPCLPYGYKIRNCVDGKKCFDQISTKPKTVLECDISASCLNKIKDIGEKNIDCGGPCTPCPTCYDKKQNQGEGGIDCGGPCNTPCPTCDDQIQNQFESDIDCGGPCIECDDSLKCYSWKDCKSHVCKGNLCAIATCTDNVKNQDEKGVDCEGVCGGQCPTCEDGIKNAGEERIDCGGPCAPCPTCEDGLKNQDEKYVDCGGKNCRSCTWNDFKQNNQQTALTLQIIVIILLLPFIALIIYGLRKRFIGKSTIEKLVLINKYLGRKAVFKDDKEEIIAAHNKLIKLQKELAESSRKNTRDDVAEIISDLLEKLLKINLTNDEYTINQKIKDHKIGYPLNRIIHYIVRHTRDISTNKYLSGLEILNKAEKLNIALAELEKET